MAGNKFTSSNENSSTYITLTVKLELEPLVLDSRRLDNLSRSFDKKSYGCRTTVKSFIEMKYTESTHISVVSY